MVTVDVVVLVIFSGICMAIGVVPLVSGILILIRRFLKKKSTGEKDRKSLVLGLILTGFGFLFAVLPMLFYLFLMAVNLFKYYL